MTTWEIIGTVIGSLCLGEVLKIIVLRMFSKNRDDFATLRERLEFQEREINGLTRQQAINNRKITRMYNCIAEMLMQTCSKQGCKMRKIIDIDTSVFDDEWENTTLLSAAPKQEMNEEIADEQDA